MTQTIEQLTARVRELEEENARLKAESRDACLGLNDYYGRKLAAEQLNNKLLRDALQEYIDEHEECQDADDWMAMMCSVEAHHAADEAISQPSDTSALDSFVAEKVKEYQERLADALAVLGADSQIEAEAVMLNYKKQVSTLTKQRDLAVEELEQRGHSAGCRKNAFGDLCTCGLDETLVAIKESEAK